LESRALLVPKLEWLHIVTNTKFTMAFHGWEFTMLSPKASHKIQSSNMTQPDCWANGGRSPNTAQVYQT